jgi:DNA-binding beta-propeller fold protein YncE
MKAASNLYSVDRVTGACTLQVPLGALSGPLDNGLAHDHKGTLYSFERTSGAADLYTIDPITGDVTFVGSNGLANLSALAFQPPPLEPLFAVDGAGGNAATLYRLDPRDGSVLQTIGPVGFAHVVGLAFHPVTGVLYATSNDGGVGGTDQLLTLDPSTGAGTAVGAHTGQITDIAFAPSGVLYGWDEDSPTNDDLATIDLATGAQTTVGECGAGTSATGLGVDAEGNAWMKSSSGLYRVERATGACTLVTGLSQPLFPSNVLAISRHGTFYTAERQGGVTELFSIDTETGDVISIGSNSIANLAALAFKPSRPTNLYAVDGASGGASSLYLLDPEDASVVANLGPTGFDHVVGLAFHPVTGALYGTSSAPFVAGGGTGELLAIDAATGAATAVGMHGTQTPDLAFAPSGLLYSWDEPSNDDLIRIDLTTGAATPVGPCGVETMRSGLAIDRAGNAFLKNASEIYSVDRTTGVCTLSATLSPPGTLHNVLTFDESGVAYSAERIGAGSRIYTADLTSGAVTLIGENDIAKLAALAFRPQPLPALYATDGAGSNPSTLYRLDPRDGSVLQTIGPIGFDHVTGISFDPITGVLYGTQSAGDDGAPASPGQLLRVDLETGAGTAVGGAHGERTPDLAFAPWGILYTWAESGDDLATLDLTTGLTTIVGDCGVSTFRTGLAADLLGNLVVKAGTEVFGVDPGTGLCTPLVSLTAPGRLHNVLEMSPRGTLFSAERIASGTDFYTVDLQTGDTVAMGSNGISDLSAVAYLPEPSSTLGIVSGAIALLVLARLRTRFAS